MSRRLSQTSMMITCDDHTWKKCVEMGTGGLVPLLACPIPKGRIQRPPADFRVKLNVGGRKFETWESTLRKFPNTLLGSDEKDFFYDQKSSEYFFDRDPMFFRHILNFYRKGILHFSYDECGVPYEEELRFYRISERHIAPCCREEFEAVSNLNYLEMKERNEKRMKCKKHNEPTGIRGKLHFVLEYPEKSMPGKVIFFIVAIAIVISIITTVVETISCGEKKCGLQYASVFKYIEAGCVGIFTIEFLVRLYVAPRRWRHARSFTSIIDLLAILPFYLNNILGSLIQSSSTQALVTLRVFRIFRVFKLLRSSERSRLLGKSLRDSAPDLAFICFMIGLSVIIFSTLIFFLEQNKGSARFSSIPASMWFAMQTMTTLGYGDLTPLTPLGKIVAAIFCLAGILVIALPVPIIEMKQNIARQYQTPEDKTEKSPKTKETEENEHGANGESSTRDDKTIRSETAV